MSEADEILLSRFADGSLDEADRPAVDDLLRNDPGASSIVESYRQLDRQLRSTSIPIRDESALVDRILDHLDEDTARAYRMPWIKIGSAIAAAAAVAVMLTVLSGLRDRPTDRSMTASVDEPPVIRVIGPTHLASLAPLPAPSASERAIRVTLEQPVEMPSDQLAALFDEPGIVASHVLISGQFMYE
jgi:anti-sigma factor RsiW